jgi:hypothetical protein
MKLKILSFLFCLISTVSFAQDKNNFFPSSVENSEQLEKERKPIKLRSPRVAEETSTINLSTYPPEFKKFFNILGVGLIYNASSNSNGPAQLNSLYGVSLLVPGFFLKYTKQNKELGSHMLSSGTYLIGLNLIAKNVPDVTPNILFGANLLLAYYLSRTAPDSEWKGYRVTMAPMITGKDIQGSILLSKSF